MTNILYILADGGLHEVDVAEGNSVMQGAIRHHAPGIIAECGGAAACATCRVQIDPHWQARLQPPESLEASVLADYEDDPSTTRLSCQIKVSEALAGLIVHIPASQY